MLPELSEYQGPVAVDLETTGLRPYHGDKIIGVSVSWPNGSRYLNFNEAEIGDLASVRPRVLLPKIFEAIGPTRLIVGANFKFDMHFLAQAGVELPNPVYDVLVMARLENNSHLRYGLDACAARIGRKKSKEVDLYLRRHRLWSKTIVPGKKTRVRTARFDLVPIEIMGPYAEQDARVTLDIFNHQQQVFQDWESACPSRPVWSLVENEKALTKVCFEMERRGMQLDPDYAGRALTHEQAKTEEYKQQFRQLCGFDLVDSAVGLRLPFKMAGVASGKTALGNDSFTDRVLTEAKHPLADCVLNYRNHRKRGGTYFSSFLYHADQAGVVRCNIRQSATNTGRFAISDPALQTLNAEEDETNEFRVRDAFVARPNYKLLSVDYMAFEFRAMLDLAGERGLAEAIEAGADPHTQTAQLVGISRRQAKTMNFGLLYGMGIGKLAGMLNVTDEEAREIKRKYFSKLPAIQSLIRSSSQVAAQRGFVYNAFNRRYYFPDSKYSYKALNYLIQGGTADAVKHAMVELHEFLKKYQSKMLLQIHDEILFELYDGEDLIEPIMEIMRRAYPSRFHKMDCSYSLGDRWGYV